MVHLIFENRLDKIWHFWNRFVLKDLLGTFVNFPPGRHYLLPFERSFRCTHLDFPGRSCVQNGDVNKFWLSGYKQKYDELPRHEPKEMICSAVPLLF